MARVYCKFTWTKLTWSTEQWDSNNNFANSTFTPTIAGRYYLVAQSKWGTTIDDKIHIAAISKNGAIWKNTEMARKVLGE